MVHQIVVVSVLKRLDTAAASVLRFAAPDQTLAFGVHCRVELVAASLKEDGLTSSQAVAENGVAPRGGSPKVGCPLKRFGVDLLCSAVAWRWAR